MTVQIVPCPACQGEGRDIRAGYVYEPGCGHAHMGDVDHGICKVCGGTGDIEEEVEGIADPDELDEVCPPQGEPVMRFEQVDDLPLYRVNRRDLISLLVRIGHIT